MKNTLTSLIFLSVSFLSFSQTVTNTPESSVEDTTMYELVDGTKITKAQLDSIFQMAWDNSFGKMTKEEEELLFGESTITVTTQPIKKEDE
jgi:hypothetical protein